MLFQLLLNYDFVNVAFFVGSRFGFAECKAFLPQLAANIVIFQTNAQFVDIFSSCCSFQFQFVFFLDCFVVPPRKDAKRRNGQGIKKERVPTFLIPLDGSGKPYQKMRKSGLLVGSMLVLAFHGAKIGAFRRTAMKYSEL